MFMGISSSISFSHIYEVLSSSLLINCEDKAFFLELLALPFRLMIHTQGPVTQASNRGLLCLAFPLTVSASVSPHPTSFLFPVLAVTAPVPTSATPGGLPPPASLPWVTTRPPSPKALSSIQTPLKSHLDSLAQLSMFFTTSHQPSHASARPVTPRYVPNAS